MKIGKLQLHQGMFPQAMKNLRLVSVPRSQAVLRHAFFWLLPGLFLVVSATLHAYARTHVPINV